MPQRSAVPRISDPLPAAGRVPCMKRCRSTSLCFQRFLPQEPDAYTERHQAEAPSFRDQGSIGSAILPAGRSIRNCISRLLEDLLILLEGQKYLNVDGYSID